MGFYDFNKFIGISPTGGGAAVGAEQSCPGIGNECPPPIMGFNKFIGLSPMGGGSP
jgi:hypothetical protein